MDVFRRAWPRGRPEKSMMHCLATRGETSLSCRRYLQIFRSTLWIPYAIVSRNLIIREITNFEFVIFTSSKLALIGHTMCFPYLLLRFLFTSRDCYVLSRETSRVRYYSSDSNP